MSELPDDPVLAPVFAKVAADWDSEGAHRALLACADEPPRLAKVAAFYRAQTSQEERREVAEAQLQRLTAKAFAQLEMARSSAQPETAKRRGQYVVILAFLLGSAFLLAYL